MKSRSQLENLMTKTLIQKAKTEQTKLKKVRKKKQKNRRKYNKRRKKHPYTKLVIKSHFNALNLELESNSVPDF
ncbi:hypothetical protein X975_27137, partial [Stegodyphus mimosarum]